MPEIKRPPHTDDHLPRQRVLGLAVLLLTFGSGYLLAHRGEPDAAAGPAADAVNVEEQSAPGEAEIIARIEATAARYEVSPRLVAAIIAVESEFNPRAVSRTGAQGLMQLMPATAAGLKVRDSFDPGENIEAGVRHLRALMDRFHDDLPLVIAAYNAGEQAVIAHRGIPPYPETRRYVVRVLRLVDRDAARAVARGFDGASPEATPAVLSRTTRLVALETSAAPVRPGPATIEEWRAEFGSSPRGPTDPGRVRGVRPVPLVEAP
jgi:transglycosylase-like protein with SLT domain